MPKETKLYATHGIFINTNRMLDICPTAAVVGMGEIKGYRLLFKGEYAQAVASLEPDKESSVPVLVWDLTPADEAALDRFEDFPARCHKESIKLKLNGKSINAFVYIANEEIPPNSPSSYHYNSILEGYEKLGFNSDVLKKALMASVHS